MAKFRHDWTARPETGEYASMTRSLMLISIAAMCLSGPGTTWAEPTPAAEPPAPPAASAPAPEEPAPIRRDPRKDDEVKIIFKDGRQVEGVYISGTPTSAIVRIAAVAVTLERESIDRIVVLPPAIERYRQMRALVKENDLERLLGLADWSRRHRLYEEARKDIEIVLREEPKNVEALRQQQLLDQIIKLEGTSPRDGGGGAMPPDRERPEVSRRLLPSEFPLLSEEQVNLIKVYEIDLADPPRVIIPRPAVEKLLAKYPDHPLIPTSRDGREAFLSSPPRTILDVMFRVRARELYSEIKVVDQPRSMATFKEAVHAGWLINNCATSRCHGGPDAGRLMLMNRRPNSDATAYTNFLILERFKTRDARELINYDNPVLSPLMHLGLPRDDSAFPHPLVRGWTPAFTSRDARRFQDTLDWIKQMYRPRPSYPIEYTPPGASTGITPARGPDEPVER